MFEGLASHHLQIQLAQLSAQLKTLSRLEKVPGRSGKESQGRRQILVCELSRRSDLFDS